MMEEQELVGLKLHVEMAKLLGSRFKKGMGAKALWNWVYRDSQLQIWQKVATVLEESRVVARQTHMCRSKLQYVWLTQELQLWLPRPVHFA